MCPLFVRLNFWQKCKAIALLVGQKLTIFITSFFDQKCVRFLSGSIYVRLNFGQKCKAIALLVGQKLTIFINVSAFCPAQCKAIALLFDQKLTIFITDFFDQQRVCFLSGSIFGKKL